MNMKMKVIIILINLILILFILSNTVFGTLVDEFYKKMNTSGADDLKVEGGRYVGFIQIIGTMVSVGMLGVLGIKYTLGSAEERAEYKKSMIPYLIGAVLIFGASNLTQIIYEWASKI